MRWANRNSACPFPAEPNEVAVYLAERLEVRGHRPATLRAAAAAISYVHRAANIEDPCADPIVKKTLKSATRKCGAFQRQAAALTMRALDHIRETACKPRKSRGGKLEDPETARRRGLFDIAMIRLMRDAMLRVSETAALRWSDLTTERDGTGRLLVRRSKTDAEGRTDILFVSAETTASLENLRESARPEDLIFDLGRNQISNRIKRAAIEAGLGDGFSGHSPRIGMARDLAREGTELPRLMTAGRWRSPRMPALYIRNESAAKGAVADYYRGKQAEHDTDICSDSVTVDGDHELEHRSQMVFRNDPNTFAGVAQPSPRTGDLDENSHIGDLHRLIPRGTLGVCASPHVRSNSGRRQPSPCITATMFYLEHAFEFFDKLIVGEARGNDQSRPYIADHST